MISQFRDVFESLNSHKVRYLVIEGVAAIVHGVPRFTFDLDLLLPKDLDNAARCLSALEEARLGTASLISAKDLIAHEITVLKDRLRIDLFTVIPGAEFEHAWNSRLDIERGGVPVHVMGLEALLASKLAKGRPVDLEDARALKADE